MYTGQLYDRLFRRGPYSIDRRLLKTGIGRSSEGKKRSRGPSYDRPLTRLPGWEGPALVDMQQGGERATLLLQLLLSHTDEDPFPWEIPPDVIAGKTSLQSALSRSGHTEAKILRYVDDDEGAISLLLEATNSSAHPTITSWVEEEQVLDVGRVWEVEPVHVRAFTMLAFHLFLALSHKRGEESAFATVREIVRGERDPYDATCNWLSPGEGLPAVPFRDERPGVPKHVFFTEITESGELVTMLRLSAHMSESLRPWWRTRLARLSSKPRGLFGLALCYFDQAEIRDGARLVGEEVPLKVDGEELVVPK